jgi:hypothetical protein
VKPFIYEDRQKGAVKKVLSVTSPSDDVLVVVRGKGFQKKTRRGRRDRGGFLVKLCHAKQKLYQQESYLKTTEIATGY